MFCIPTLFSICQFFLLLVAYGYASKPLLSFCASIFRCVCPGGLGVLESGYLGIFDLVTSPMQRRRGYATALIQGLLKWGIEKGAFFSYIQVVKANIPARNLYAKLGYQPIYEYWYRVGCV